MFFDLQKYINRKKRAFTLSEVLIALVIIGVVAAITLPAVTANSQHEIAVNRLKKTYSVLGNALNKSQSDNGAFSTWETKADIDVDAYFQKYWLPYFIHLQYHEQATDIGYESNYPWKNLNGDRIGWNVISHPTRILFTLPDGTVVFYPISTTDINGNPLYVSSFYVDINGSQKPNILGRDVFLLSVIDHGGVKGHCSAGYNPDVVDANCSKRSNGNENCCAAKIIKDGWQIKDDYPW